MSPEQQVGRLVGEVQPATKPHITAQALLIKLYQCDDWRGTYQGMARDRRRDVTQSGKRRGRGAGRLHCSVVVCHQLLTRGDISVREDAEKVLRNVSVGTSSGHQA